ncbi:MAG: DUF559 domain-containing protein [Planctomycetota bacterium]|nr:DUF559 domain-containing protein [Planctomycetota bacterium]
MADKIVDVDIVVPDFRLVVEFDGWYWHQEKIGGDKRKTALLEDAGWRVIRVREEPLELLGANDVVAPQGDLKAVANMVLLKIQQLCNVHFPGLDDYLRRESLVNSVKAEAVIREYLAKKSQMESGTDERQLLLFSMDDN